MKEKLSKVNKNMKVQLSKEQQMRMLEFFSKTSIPRMLQSINKEVK